MSWTLKLDAEIVIKSFVYFSCRYTISIYIVDDMMLLSPVYRRVDVIINDGQQKFKKIRKKKRKIVSF